MALPGSLKLKSASLLDMYNAVNSYSTEVQDTLYEQYKAAYKLTMTNYMRGDAADAFKSYFAQGTLNMIQGILDISSEIMMIIQLITEVFYQFEGAENGIIKESQLDDINTALNEKKKSYDSMNEELITVMRLAAQYISTVDIGYSEVDEAYSDIKQTMQRMRENMYSIDADALVSAQELLSRIQELQSQITMTMGLCYKDGNFIPDNAATLTKQSWYSKQTNATLTLLLAEDPFEYEAGEVSISEDQWAAGLCSDVYVYGGYSFFNASYEAGIENDSAFMKARASVIKLNGYAQLTDYIKAQGEMKVIYGEIDGKVGAGEGYFGAHVKAEAGVLRINGSVVVGTDNFNGYIKGDAQVLTANGKAAFEFEDDGQFAVGVDAGATLASASLKEEFNFFKYKIDDGSATAQETDNLFKLSAKEGVTMGAAFATYAESKTAIETDFANINATSLKVVLGLGLDLEVNVTVPTIYMKWKW